MTLPGPAQSTFEAMRYPASVPLWRTEASGFLVGPAVFKTVERVLSPLAGSIPVRLR